MKTLKESLKHYLVAESNSINIKQVEQLPDKTIMHIPGMIWSDWDNSSTNGGWKYSKPQDLELPKANFYLFHDKYRNCPHITTLTDIAGYVTSIMNIDNIERFDDYEVYSPKDIIMSSDSIVDLLNKMIEAGYIKKNGDRYKKLKNFYDSEEFIEDAFYDPKWVEEHLLDDNYSSLDEFATADIGLCEGLFDKSGKLYWASNTLFDSLLKAGFGNVLKTNNKANLNKLTIEDLTKAGFFKK